MALKYRRLLLKAGGESLSGPGASGIDPAAVEKMVDLFVSLHDLGAEVGGVLGGGNFLRGRTLAGGSLTRVTADAMGMLATVMNAVALGDALRARGKDVRVLTPFQVGGFTELFSAPAARRHMEAGCILLLAGGIVLRCSYLGLKFDV